MQEPLVTVFSMCYNQAQYVIDSLESIRNQTYKNYQLIISDDCSSDNSVETITKWIDENSIECTFIPHEKNQGICKTLNELLTHTKGKYVAMLAADDTWEAEKLADQVNIMESLPEDYGIVYSDAQQFDENGKQFPKMYIETHREFTSLPEGTIFNTLAKGNFLAAHSALIRRSVYDTIGVYDERLIYEDWDFWLRASLRFKFKYSEYVSAWYRVVSTSITKQHLHTRSTKAEISDFIIYEKCIKTKRLHSDVDALFREKMTGIAKRLYWKGYKNRVSILFTANRYNPTFQTLGMLLKALIYSPKLRK